MYCMHMALKTAASVAVSVIGGPPEGKLQSPTHWRYGLLRHVARSFQAECRACLQGRQVQQSGDFSPLQHGPHGHTTTIAGREQLRPVHSAYRPMSNQLCRQHPASAHSQLSGSQLPEADRGDQSRCSTAEPATVHPGMDRQASSSHSVYPAIGQTVPLRQTSLNLAQLFAPDPYRRGLGNVEAWLSATHDSEPQVPTEHLAELYCTAASHQPLLVRPWPLMAAKHVLHALLICSSCSRNTCSHFWSKHLQQMCGH